MIIDARSSSHLYIAPRFAPWQHQASVVDATWNLDYYAIFAEPRTGKTRIILDTVYRLYERAELRTLVVIAPNGVHRNWATDEIPRWLHPATDYRCLVWRSGRAKTRAFARDLASLVHHAGLAIFVANVDAATNPRLVETIAELAQRGRMFGVSDESADLSHTTSQRQKAMVKLRRYFHWRRILDGTPVDESPLDAYGQVEFLRPDPFGFSNFVAFKRRYAVLQRQAVPGAPLTPHAACRGAGCAGCGYIGDLPARSYEVVVGYKNLPEYRAKLAKFAAVIRRADVADLPERTVTRRYYQLSPEQARVYDDLADRFVSELSDGRTVTAAMVLTRYLRLQQVCHNFFPAAKEPTPCDACAGEGCDACSGLGFRVEDVPLTVIDPDRHPRLEALFAELRTMGEEQCTIWTTFHHDGDAITAALGKSPRLGRAVRYDGTISERQRAVHKTVYQEGHCQYLIGTPAAGGRGLDFSNAPNMIFYGHTYRRRLRSQAEDRGESLRRSRGLAIVDLVAEGTVDETILDALTEKKSLADYVLGASNWRELLKRRE